MTSEATARARAFVAEHLPEARGLGQALADLIDDPDAFAVTLETGLGRLSDPGYAAEQERVAPGSGAVIGVRWPLWHAAARQLREPLRASSSASALSLAQRLAIAPVREVRLFATVPLERSLTADPERTWQVIRRLGRAASDWISVDSMADLVAWGIILEPVRWAELEQLVYSRDPWERRLVGSTLARMPSQVTATERARLDSVRALTLIESLIGDADPNVQKALSWALRGWAGVDEQGVVALLEAEAARAARTADGHRAWVIRDALSSLPRGVAERLRARLEGLRRRPGGPSTSQASAVAQGFLSALEGADTAVARQGDRMVGAAR